MPETTRDGARAALIAVAAGNFMVQLAMMPVSSILPTVASSFGVEAATASWVMNAYLLTLTGLVLTTGRLGDLYGHRQIFLGGVTLFTIGAVAAGLAPSFVPMILARAVQGVGGALMMGASLALVVNAVPADRRGQAIGLSAVSASLGALIGVAMGSYLMELLTWRAIFLVVAPAGAFTFVAALRLPPDPDRSAGTPRPDVVGSALLFSILATLSLSFSHLHDGGASFQAGWAYHTGMQVLTAVLVAAFVVVELRHRAPMMPLHLFRHRVFTLAILANCCLHMTMMGSMFLVPFLIEQGMSLPASAVGAVLMPMQLASMGASYVGGWLYDRTRSRLIAPVALGVVGVGLATLGLNGASMGQIAMMALLATVGVGTNIFMASNNTVAMSSLPAHLSGFSSGMLETSRQLGHTVAVALAAGVLGLVAEQNGSGASHEQAVYGFTLAILSFSAVAFVGLALAVGGSATHRTAMVRRQPLIAD